MKTMHRLIRRHWSPREDEIEYDLPDFWLMLKCSGLLQLHKILGSLLHTKA